MDTWIPDPEVPAVACGLCGEAFADHAEAQLEAHEARCWLSFQVYMADCCRRCRCCRECDQDVPCAGTQQGALCDERCDCDWRDDYDDADEDGIRYDERGGRLPGYECDHYDGEACDD